MVKVVSTCLRVGVWYRDVTQPVQWHVFSAPQLLPPTASHGPLRFVKRFHTQTETKSAIKQSSQKFTLQYCKSY